MPQIRKLTPEELHEIEARERQANLAQQLYGPSGEPPHQSSDDLLVIEVEPRIGDVVQIMLPEITLTGVVLSCSGDPGSWKAMQLLVDGKRRWFTTGTVARVLGRPRGISRIDHPARRTHGWYVRLYNRGVPRLSRLFSDGQYHGITGSLEAALAFHQAAEIDAEQHLA